MILTSETIPPKCCDTPHAGMTCADGLTQCCLCYKRFALADLYVGADGWTWDYCKVCAERESVDGKMLLTCWRRERARQARIAALVNNGELSEYEARASYHWNGKR